MHSLGNLALIDLHKVAFLCSRNCPEEATAKAYRWAVEQREKGICVISGYHSATERGVLSRLLEGTQPVIIVLAKGLLNLDPELDAPVASGRLLILTRYADSVSHACESKCYHRNRMMLEMADEVVVAHASAGGKLERLTGEFHLKNIVWL